MGLKCVVLPPRPWLQVAGARTWEDIRNVADEYMRRFQGEDEIIPFEGFDESLDEAESNSQEAEEEEEEVSANRHLRSFCGGCS